MKIFLRINREINRDLQLPPPEVITDQSFFAGHYYKSEMDEEDSEEILTWRNEGNWFEKDFTTKDGTRTYWFELV